MKKLLVLVACFSAFILLNSCDDERFDFSDFESVNVSGQWNVPIGTKDLSFEMFLDQLANNDLVSFDSLGNMQLSYGFRMDTVVFGAEFMRYDDVHAPLSTPLENPYTYVLDAPKEDTLHVEQPLSLESDIFLLKSAKVRSGSIETFVETDVPNVRKIIIRSPNMYEANGEPVVRELVLGQNHIDLSGVRLVSAEGNAVTFIYDICYQAYDYTDPYFMFDGNLSLTNLKIQELTGHIADYSTHFRIDTSFTMPVEQINGDIIFADARLNISDRNSFGVSARLQLDTAMLYGENVAPTNIFTDYPVIADIDFSPNYVPMFNQNFALNLNSDLSSVLISGDLIFNSGDGEVTLNDTATMGVAAEAVVPIVFNIPEVTYEDTLNIEVNEFETPELITEVLLHVDFESELPFNFKAQLFTLEQGARTDSLFVNPAEIRGSFDGVPANTEAEVSITHDRLNNLINADGLLMRLKVNTDDNNVSLNLEDMLRVTLRAQINYDGELSN